MRSRFNFALSVVTGSLAAFSFGCSDGIVPTPVGSGGVTAGGTVATGGQPEVGGTVGSGGKETGGTTATGGKIGSGGDSGTGGATSSGGVMVGSGGKTGTGGDATSSGGVTIGSGGRTGTGGASVAGSGGVTMGSGGKTGTGGASATGGASTGGSTGTPPAGKKFFGNIDTNGQIRSDFKTMWDQFSPENAGKWGSVQGGSQSSFNWGSLDAMYKYCQDNNIIFKEHCFVWASQQPSFVNSSNAESAVKNWMSNFCQRYPKVAMIDVVNEALHVKAGYISGMGGAGTSGYDWIVNAFKWAKDACPNAILIYNDYNTIEYSGENGNVVKLVKAVTGAGGPIMAVGCQGHDVAKNGVSTSTVKTYTDNIISATGLPIYITEMDIGVQDDNQQATIMKDIVTALWNTENVKGITYWGYIVGSTWRANTGLMTSSGTKRPALTWLMSFLGR